MACLSGWTTFVAKYITEQFNVSTSQGSRKAQDDIAGEWDMTRQYHQDNFIGVWDMTSRQDDVTGSGTKHDGCICGTTIII
jgi:hypothetical protein